MLSIQTEQYFPLYKFTWEKFQSTNEGTWAGKRTKVSRSRFGEELEKTKRFKQTLRIRGQEGDIIHLTENKCLFFMNSKISFKNSYSIIFAKQVQRGLWAVRKPPSVHWAHPRLHESLFNAQVGLRRSTPEPLAARQRDVYVNCREVWSGEPGAIDSPRLKREGLPFPLPYRRCILKPRCKWKGGVMSFFLVWTKEQP